MDADLFNSLNKIYQPICERSDEIENRLKDEGFAITGNGFYNGHYVSANGGFILKYYPTPEITVGGVGDIGVDIDSVWIEIKLPKDKAVLLDYSELSRAYKIEVYGAENYLDDFYNASYDSSEVIEKIEKSGETLICVLFYLDNKDGVAEDLVKIIRLFV